MTQDNHDLGAFMAELQRHDERLDQEHERLDHHAEAFLRSEHHAELRAHHRPPAIRPRSRGRRPGGRPRGRRTRTPRAGPDGEPHRSKAVA